MKVSLDHGRIRKWQSFKSNRTHGSILSKYKLNEENDFIGELE